MTAQILTQKRLKELLHYCPDTGAFTWIKSSRSGWIGKTAGCDNGDGYIRIGLDGRNYLAHRLSFLYVNGKMPDQTDHINHDVSDNRFENIRDVNRETNQQNAFKRIDNTSGVTGVYWHKRMEKWQSRIAVNGKNIALGTFANKHKAIAVRKAAEVAFNFHPNHGRK